MDRRHTSEEDLILLLGADVGQFRSAAQVIDEAEKEAAKAGIATFDPAMAERWLTHPRREIYRGVDERIANFSRCGIPSVDEWADQFRLDRRMALARALALLELPEDAWRELPKQSYISTILGFFSKKITSGVLRGPLARMTISKSAARVNLTELGTERMPAADILTQLLARTSRDIGIDPTAFAEELLERRLRSLHSHSLLYRRDTGIDGLYLGFPFLLMRDQRSDARTGIAPVLLWPVRITPEVGNRGHVTLGFGRDHGGDRDPNQVILNPAFEGLMGFEGATRWQEAAEELLTRASISVADAVDAFGTLAAPRGNTLARLPEKDVEVRVLRPELAPSAVLFHLAFMEQAIVKDLDHLKQRSPEGTGLETALRLGEVALERQPVARAKEADKYFTADSDPSREQAVMEARLAPGLVVEGPPGTGKSQTIVNMVADSIGRGKSLLVICQKQAALEVVRKRLERETLAERIVMVTDINRDREPIARAIREQVQALHMRPTGAYQRRKRERELLATRIELLEGELDGHQAALHRIDDRTGLTYRTLLGELIALDDVWPSPLSLPGLRARLSKLHPSEVAAIEESCAPLARFWLPAKFEDSALSALRTFNPDQGSLELFITTFKGFIDAEVLRSTINGETADAFRIENATPLRSWLGPHEVEFRSLSPQFSANLARWLPLFRSLGGATRGASMLADLQDASINMLDASARDLPASPKLRAIEDAEFASAVALVESAMRPSAGLRRLSPKRWFARKRLRKLLSSMALPKDGLGMADFAAATQLESEVRPLRHRVEAASRTMFGKGPDPAWPIARLAILATDLHALLARVQTLVQVSDGCPEAVELERALKVGSPEAIVTFLDRLGRSLRRHDSRMASLAALESVGSYFEEKWVTARRSAIENEGSNGTALGAIVDALPTLAPYQEFRTRASRLGERELAIFRVLRRKEDELERLSPDDLDACVRRTIGAEARLSWKLRPKLPLRNFF
jgi:hypothetical protein